jgi:predicted PilT family ATPase
MFRISYLVDDKHLATALRSCTGIAHDLQVVPVVNATRTRNGDVKAKTDGRMSDMIVEYMREKDIAEITGPQVKAFVTEIGGAPQSYNHHINEAVKRKLLKKMGKGRGNSVRYARVLVREA